MHMIRIDQNHLDVDDVDDIERFAARTGGFTNKCKVFLPPLAYRTKK